MKALVQNTLLVLCSTAFSLLLLEASFRVHSKLTESAGIESISQSRERPLPGQRSKLGHMIQLSSNPHIIYEFIPGISVIHINTPVVINVDGFRGPAIALDKPANYRRIVGIGDSVMYGWGVREEDSYLSLLEDLLNANEKGPGWQVLNTAVPGYNTAMEVETLKDKGLAYAPDVVLLGFVENDFSLPRFIQQPQNYWTTDRSFLLERLGVTNRKGGGLTDTPGDFQGGMRLDDISLEQVPPMYRDMVGLPGVLRSFNELAELKKQYGFEVVVLVFRFWPKELAQTARAHGFHVVNAHRAWKDYTNSQGLDPSPKGFRRTESDPHPSAQGHQAIAQGLNELLLTLFEDNAAAR